MIHHCRICAKDVHHYKVPLMPTSLPSYPWQVIGSDLFELKGTNYLLLVDYFSRYLEVVKMSSTTSHAVITAMKSIFSCHGLPETLRSDNGPQFSSQEMAESLLPMKYNTSLVVLTSLRATAWLNDLYRLLNSY